MTQVQSLGQKDPPGGGPGNPHQYSSLENPMDRGVWQAIVYSVTELDMSEGTEHAPWVTMRIKFIKMLHAFR